MGSRKKKGRKQKPRSYFMRYQPKMRRRRECKTDYQARACLIKQDKDKYNTPKYRFVVRISNKNVTCQVVSSKIIGDFVHCTAYSSELPRYGLDVGLTNWAACYSTGLLCARRMLKKLGMDEMYKGVETADGKYFETEEDEEKRPFKCLLDVGLKRTTTGSTVYAALKGAVDGGLYIPHRDSGKQFPGYSVDSDNGPKYNATRCLHYIVGGHVKEYMEKLEEEKPDVYASRFASYIAKGIKPDDLEDVYRKVHAAIRANPDMDTTARATRESKYSKASVSKFVGQRKKTRAERRDHVLNKILSIRRKAAQA